MLLSHPRARSAGLADHRSARYVVTLTAVVCTLGRAPGRHHALAAVFALQSVLLERASVAPRACVSAHARARARRTRRGTTARSHRTAPTRPQTAESSSAGGGPSRRSTAGTPRPDPPTPPPPPPPRRCRQTRRRWRRPRRGAGACGGRPRPPGGRHAAAFSACRRSATCFGDSSTRPENGAFNGT